MLLNFQGAALRVTSTGIYWGMPYIVAPKYLLKDSANYPTSRFIIDKDAQDWLRFIYANIGDNLTFCPAPASKATKTVAQNPKNLPKSQTSHKNSQNIHPTQNLKNPLNDFVINDSWLARILAIIHTSDSEESSVGVCGVCLLHSFQIIAEVLESPLSPRTNGGYFFDTQNGANPFISFEARNSLLYHTLDDIVSWFPAYAESPIITEQMKFDYNNNLALMSAIALLPQYDWAITTRAQEQSDIPRVIDSIFESAYGSAFVVLFRMQSTQQEGGHAMVAIRTRAGVVLIPTNVQMSAEELRIFTAPMHDRSEFLTRFSEYGFRITNIALLGVRGLLANPFASNISLSDCTGEGEDRRGNGALPTSALVNQCASGRCLE